MSKKADTTKKTNKQTKTRHILKETNIYPINYKNKYSKI